MAAIDSEFGCMTDQVIYIHEWMQASDVYVLVSGPPIHKAAFRKYSLDGVAHPYSELNKRFVHKE